MSDEAAKIDQKTTKHRSPNYPDLSLPEALTAVRRLYEDHKRNAVYYDAALSTLNYKPKSGTGGRAVASLITYGLAEDEGSSANRKIKVSDLAYRILHLPEDDPDWLEAVRDAAVRPKIYAEMLVAWPESLPAETAMTKYLIIEKGFNPTSVKDVINSFRATYDFAQLGTSGTITPALGDTAGGKLHPDTPAPEVSRPSGAAQQPAPKPTVPVGMKPLTIPLGPESEVTIHYPANLTPEDFDFFIETLGSFKRRITVAPPPPPFVRPGAAIWRSNDVDHPVRVVGYLGEQHGRHFAKIEGTGTGVPLDELVYDE